MIYTLVSFELSRGTSNQQSHEHKQLLVRTRKTFMFCVTVSDFHPSCQKLALFEGNRTNQTHPNLETVSFWFDVNFSWLELGRSQLGFAFIFPASLCNARSTAALYLVACSFSSCVSSKLRDISSMFGFFHCRTEDSFYPLLNYECSSCEKVKFCTRRMN